MTQTIECESCGKLLSGTDEYYVHHPTKIIMCKMCFEVPTELLKTLHDQIHEFDEACEDSFLFAEDEACGDGLS